ncbi:MAG TPA: ABC transporter substrate-binding protein, partial [Acidimicrobiales bacterium]|nr:ABC transporter substrate-binding protein [Acidimicrobiales bacterium]
MAVASAALILAACSSSTNNSTSTTSSGSSNTNSNSLFDPASFHPSWLNSNVNGGGSPVRGGTLKIEGSTDLSAALDTGGEYETIGYELERVFARQLVSYPPSSNIVKSDTVVPDVATSLGTVSPDGLTYTFHLRSGVMWNTAPPRPVTSQDFLLGFKRLCDPTLAPNGNPGYYISTIKGFGDFCTPFMGMDPTSSAASRAAYVNGHQITGISTPDASTIVFTLTQPAADFIYILALPFSSAAPVEYLKYVPLTPGNPIISDGPYQVSNYNVGHEVDFTRNPQWHQSNDSIRHDYVDAINVKLDLSGAAAAAQVQQDMQAGTADLAFNTIVPTASIPGFEAPTWNPQFGTFPAPGINNPYLVFNVQSPNNGGALGNKKVRQALEYAIDKIA